MHAPGIPPQHHHRPSTEGVVALRVLFALLPVLSCGFLAWGTMLRLAIVTRATRDWTLLALSCLLSVASVALIGADPTPDTSGWQGNAGAGIILLTGFATCVYFLVADIRHHEKRAAAPAAHWYAAQNPTYPGPQQQTTPAYGYPPVQPPVQSPAQTPLPTPPPPQVPPQPTPPPRIGQVRAELDELSELLRKQTPPPPGGPYQDPNRTAVQGPEQ
ncbi:hypothetical protein ACIGQE_22805 [Streptomyces sp. NPDC053429]|uniref:hypothetical protein n=1 Tax=unclassified Streptomyces TaxID=2593676 RepID=UPI0033DB1250